jgi:copper(I)-binding protein
MIKFTALISAATISLLLSTAAHADSMIGDIMLDDAWARPTVQGQQAGGGFIVLMNHGKSDDRLLSASSPAAGRVELHSMSMDGDVMRMRQVPNIELKAGKTVALKPGGLHVMFMDLKKPLDKGAKIPVTLVFEKAGKATVDFEVKSPSGSNNTEHQHHH